VSTHVARRGADSGRPTDHRPFVEVLTGNPELIRTEFDALIPDASPEFTFPWVAD
jgi:hypothetical protein